MTRRDGAGRHASASAAAGAVAAVDLEVPQGILTAVLGPSGCGKTTLLRLIAGFVDPDAGVVRFGGPRRRGRRPRTPAAAAAPGRLRARRRERCSRTSTSAPTSPSACRARRGAARLGSARCSTWSSCRRRRATATRTSSPAASSSGSRWPAPWPPSPPSCCSTSRSRRSTLSCARSTGRAVVRALRAAGATAVLVTHDQGEALSPGRPGRGHARRPAGPGGHPSRPLPLAGRRRRRTVRGRRRRAAAYGPRRHRGVRAGDARGRESRTCEGDALVRPCRPEQIRMTATQAHGSTPGSRT